MRLTGIAQRWEPIANVSGLGVWAGSQMLLMIAAASALSLDVVGVFSLGLTVFSLLMIALGLNLRLAIAVDDENRIALLPALAIRLATVLAVLAIALAAMRIYAPGPEAFALGALLLSGRIADQIVDLFYGFHQKHGRGVLVSQSFFLRGAMTCLLCLALVLWRDNAQAVVLAGSLVYCLASLLIEVALFRGRWRPEPKQRPVAALGEVLGNANVRSFSTFPMFDALHFNSFRLAIALLLDAHAYGLFALAMNAYSAVQVVVSALALTSLARLKSGRHHRAPDPVAAMLRDALVQGGSCLAMFACCSLAFALAGGLWTGDPKLFELLLAGNFAALLLFPFAAFVAQGSIFFGARAGYWQAPLIGSLAFGLAAALLAGLGALLQWPPLTGYAALCVALLLSSLLRICVSLHRLHAPRIANA